MSFLESTNHHILPEYSNGQNMSVSHWNNGNMDDSMTDLNEELPIQTPSKPVSRMPSKVHDNHSNVEEMMDCESTLAADSQEPGRNEVDTDMTSKDRHLDIIAMNVNNTIQELNKIYNQIGYSTTEISIKKSEIFTVIEDTISNFTSSLQREKNNIENECEWLRQQIRIILAMVNDNNGEKALSLTERGIVFSNRTMYEQGYKDDILTKLANIQNRKQNFYANSPFNITSTGIPQTDFSFESQYEYMLNNIPELSLLQLKNKLNSTFLEVLKIFIRCFKKLNDHTITYLDLHDAIGEYYSPDAKVMILKTLPTREEAEQHKALIEQFESTIKYLKLSKKDSKVEPIMNLKSKNSDEFAVIISSPRKADAKTSNTPQIMGNNQKENTESGIENSMNQLRDLNYKIVRVIRSLKFTKITNEFLSNIQTEIEHCEIEFNDRNDRMKEIINKCFEHINILNLNEEQVIKIQKQYDITDSKNGSAGNDGYFDIETLRFIQTNPKEFGLNDNHLNFVGKFADILQKIRDAKQMKWDYYLTSCKSLWTKLGESNEYISTFLNANSSLTDISLMNFKMELNRLYMRRSEFIENFIIDSRMEIEELWNKMYFANDQKKCFKHYNYDVNDDDLDKETVLNEHEVELSRLKKEYESKEHILKMYTQLNDLVKDQNFLKDSSKDSSRLLSKNSCKILLNEEKIRKRIIKNMPKLVDGLKADVIKYNHEQLSSGSKPFTINGEDFFEKLLIIESEQLNQGTNRSSRNKFRNNTLESPKKISNNPKSSPLKSTGRSPIIQARGGSTTSSVNRTRGPSPYARKSPLKVSPLRNQQAIKKPINKHTKAAPPKSFTTIHQNSKFANAINLSLSSHSDSTSSSSLESPIRTASRTNSNMTKFMDARLQPLNSPLTFNNDETIRIFNDNDDITNHSHISRLSPLRFNTSLNIDNGVNNKSEKIDFTPIQKYGFIDSSYIDDREKKDVRVNQYALSPIKVIAIDNDKENEDTNARTSKNMTCDSSTIIGDDYQAWRDERIRQLNSLT